MGLCFGGFKGIEYDSNLWIGTDFGKIYAADRNKKNIYTFDGLFRSDRILVGKNTGIGRVVK
jgi:hypothetical protein